MSIDINKMVDNFLQWKLPSDFHPDAGISFKNDFNENTPWPMKHNPTGTNLFHAGQAKAMIEAMLVGAVETYIRSDNSKVIADQAATIAQLQLRINQLQEFIDEEDKYGLVTVYQVHLEAEGWVDTDKYSYETFVAWGCKRKLYATQRGETK